MFPCTHESAASITRNKRGRQLIFYFKKFGRNINQIDLKHTCLPLLLHCTTVPAHQYDGTIDSFDCVCRNGSRCNLTNQVCELLLYLRTHFFQFPKLLKRHFLLSRKGACIILSLDGMIHVQCSFFGRRHRVSNAGAIFFLNADG